MRLNQCFPSGRACADKGMDHSSLFETVRTVMAGVGVVSVMSFCFLIGYLVILRFFKK